MPNYDWILNVKDTHVTLTYNLKDTNSAPIDLSGATAVYWVVKYNNTEKASKQMTVSDAVNGVVTVSPDAGMLYEGINRIYVYVDWDGSGNSSWSVTNHNIMGEL